MPTDQLPLLIGAVIGVAGTLLVTFLKSHLISRQSKAEQHRRLMELVGKGKAIVEPTDPTSGLANDEVLAAIRKQTEVFSLGELGTAIGYVEEANKQLEQLTTKMASLQDELKTLRRERAQLRAKTADFERQRVSLEAKHAQLLAKTADFERQRVSLEAERARLREGRDG
jgi:chromosome segregation ATPase